MSGPIVGVYGIVVMFFILFVLRVPAAFTMALVGFVGIAYVISFDAAFSIAGTEMWNIFSADCTSPGNELPRELRASIISLALWVNRFSSEVIAGRESINDLIEVNRSVMEGLAAQRLAKA